MWGGKFLRCEAGIVLTCNTARNAAGSDNGKPPLTRLTLYRSWSPREDETSGCRALNEAS